MERRSVPGKTACMTAGLRGLYTGIAAHPRGSRPSPYQSFTDEDGAFVPTPPVPLLANRYRVLKRIGRGSFCTLLRAEDTFKEAAAAAATAAAGGAGGSVSSHVAIKVMHRMYTEIGIHEAQMIREVNARDARGFVPIVRCLNTFFFQGHFCMVFELMSITPVRHCVEVVSQVTSARKISLERARVQAVRKVASQLMTSLALLKRMNVIHADIKPENLLLRDDDASSCSVKLCDFGNSLHATGTELTQYYQDFECQSLWYRAPEVLLGVEFATPVDAWSAGCVIAELYTGSALFGGTSKEEVLRRICDVTGPLPAHPFRKGKFFKEMSGIVKVETTALAAEQRHRALCVRLMDLLETKDYDFASFLAGLLDPIPENRMTPEAALQHSFLAHLFPFRLACPDSVPPYAPFPSYTTDVNPSLPAKPSPPGSPALGARRTAFTALGTGTLNLPVAPVPRAQVKRESPAMSASPASASSSASSAATTPVASGKGSTQRKSGKAAHPGDDADILVAWPPAKQRSSTAAPPSKQQQQQQQQHGLSPATSKLPPFPVKSKERPPKGRQDKEAKGESSAAAATSSTLSSSETQRLERAAKALRQTPKKTVSDDVRYRVTPEKDKDTATVAAAAANRPAKAESKNTATTAAASSKKKKGSPGKQAESPMLNTAPAPFSFALSIASPTSSVASPQTDTAVAAAAAAGSHASTPASGLVIRRPRFDDVLLEDESPAPTPLHSAKTESKAMAAAPAQAKAMAAAPAQAKATEKTPPANAGVSLGDSSKHAAKRKVTPTPDVKRQAGLAGGPPKRKHSPMKQVDILCVDEEEDYGSEDDTEIAKKIFGVTHEEVEDDILI